MRNVPTRQEEARESVAWGNFSSLLCMISGIIMHSKNCGKILQFFLITPENPVLSRA
jgi:hypothetical protein